MTPVSPLRWFLSIAVLYVLLAIPDNPWAFDPTALLYFPWELILLSLLPAAFSQTVWRRVQPVIAALVTLVLAVKVGNIVALEGFDRPFSPLVDLPLIPTALGTLAMNSLLLAAGAALGVVAVLGAIAALVQWSLTGLARAAARPSWHAVTLALIAVAAALSPLKLANSPSPLASAATTLLVRDQVMALVRDLGDSAAFARDLDRPAPAVNLTPANVDVVIVFIESYGRSALEREPQSAMVRGALRDAEATLTQAGFQSRSAWATSPTFGGESWLAHSTVLSGLWVTTQARYRALTGSRHSTLVGDFKNAGWRTTAFLPEITGPWPERAFYGFDSAYTAPEIGYQGPPFGYMTMPDQFVLQAFNQKEFQKPGRPPLLAELALVSSHIPWAPIPAQVPWEAVGDGKVFAGARSPEDAAAVWRDPSHIPVFYGRSLDYVLRTLASFITTYGRDNSVFILLGDHQPMSFIAGDDATHDVPVHVVTRDAALLAKLAGEDWALGLTPTPANPALPMDALRGRITAAFSR